MPLYEFSCSTCGKKFEKRLPLSTDQTDVRCPSGHRHVHRIYAASLVMFKGSGFYITDHPAGTAANTNKS